MCKKLYAIILFLLIVTSELVFGKETNKHKIRNDKKLNHPKEKTISERNKRSLNDEEDKPFWANRGKKQIESINNNNRYDNDLEKLPRALKISDYIEKDPFWGARGRRESSSAQNYMDAEYLEYPPDNSDCRNCYGTIHAYANNRQNSKDRRDDSVEPFWGNRGRRNSDEINDFNDAFWSDKGSRQDIETFWGQRGWQKGSLDALGRREDEQLWGSRDRRDEVEPFWGNRGRRQDSEPFWGNRGRRQYSKPFLGNRGRVVAEQLSRRNKELKDSILKAINFFENDIEYLSRLRRSDQSSFFQKGIESNLNQLSSLPKARNMNFDPGEVSDSRIYADEPNYIVVERNSRSSGEAEDPFYISRGKKYSQKYQLIKAARDRRGALEEIVKSVRNDPYYIARGKKDSDINVVNTTSNDELKAKELICSVIGLINEKQHGKAKREIDSDRYRRSILKKLAAQLQTDPYFVSRGKKNDDTSRFMLEFIKDVAGKCN